MTQEMEGSGGVGGVLNVLNGLTSVQWRLLDSKRAGPQEGLACVWIPRRWTR